MKLSVRRKEYVCIYISFEMIHMQIEGYRSHSYLFKFKKSSVRTLEIRQEEKKKKKERRTSIILTFFLQLASIITITGYFVKF